MPSASGTWRKLVQIDLQQPTEERTFLTFIFRKGGRSSGFRWGRFSDLGEKEVSLSLALTQEVNPVVASYLRTAVWYKFGSLEKELDSQKGVANPPPAPSEATMAQRGHHNMNSYQACKYFPLTTLRAISVPVCADVACTLDKVLEDESLSSCWLIVPLYHVVEGPQRLAVVTESSSAVLDGTCYFA